MLWRASQTFKRVALFVSDNSVPYYAQAYKRTVGLYTNHAAFKVGSNKEAKRNSSQFHLIVLRVN